MTTAACSAFRTFRRHPLFYDVLNRVRRNWAPLILQYLFMATEAGDEFLLFQSVLQYTLATVVNSIQIRRVRDDMGIPNEERGISSIKLGFSYRHSTGLDLGTGSRNHHSNSQAGYLWTVSDVPIDQSLDSAWHQIAERWWTIDRQGKRLWRPWRWSKSSGSHGITFFENSWQGFVAAPSALLIRVLMDDNVSLVGKMMLKMSAARIQAL